ncbi:DNA polymerase III subunit beta [Patescibacteria group bacterium]
MNLTILQENLSNGLNKVSKFIDNKAQLSILANILLVAEKGKLKLSATNLETGINLKLPAKVLKEGRITIPARTIVDFVSSLPADKIDLNLNKNQLTISCRNYKATLNGVSAEEFPAVPTLLDQKIEDKLEQINLQSKTFFQAVSQVAFTAAVDESRPILTGVKVEFFKEKIVLAATDGYRLSLKTIKVKKGAKKKTLIIPSRALLELTKIYSQEEENKNISLTLLKGENQAIFSINETEIITRLIEGEFPDIEKIIPQGKTTTIKLNKQDFQNAVKTASIFAKDSANIIKLKVEKEKLKIMANAPEVGENEVELEVKKDGEDNSIAFNFRFLQEYLNCLESEELVLDVLGPLKPGVFKPVDDDLFFYIIMPVRVQE